MTEDKKEKATGFNIAQLRTDKKKDVEGVWVDYAGNLKFKVARANNPKAKALRNKLFKKNAHAIQSNDMQVIEKISNEVTARHILLDWVNMEDYDDKGVAVSVAYSEAKALELLTTIPKLADDIAVMAGDFEAYQLHTQDEDIKN